VRRGAGRQDAARGVGEVTELHRYPVKSLVGERVPEVAIDRRGVVGDRWWAVTDLDGKLGSGKTSTRFRRMDGLLDLAASYDGEVPVVTFPDGRSHTGPGDATDAALSDHVGRPVRLRAEDRVPHLDEGPLHLLTTASLAALAAHHGGPVPVARMRPSVVLDVPGERGFVEDVWVGRRLALGDEVVVTVTGPMPRCVMVDAGQPGLAPDQGLLRTIGAVNAGCLGVVADVLAPGRLAVGDRATLLP
jgi:uncharacterized protein